MASITQILWNWTKAYSRPIINTNFTNLNNDIILQRGLPQWMMINWQIVVWVDWSWNMTISIKTLNWVDPSSNDPIFVRIWNNVRSITNPLKITWTIIWTNIMNLWWSELWGKTVDCFVYLWYKLSWVFMGFARTPNWKLVSNFNRIDWTNENYLYVSDWVVTSWSEILENVGRFTISLSLWAWYTWSINWTWNIINRPTFQTDWQDYQPVYTASGSMTFWTVTTNIAKYKIINDTLFLNVNANWTTGWSADNEIRLSVPFSFKNTSWQFNSLAGWVYDAGYYAAIVDNYDATTIRLLKNWWANYWLWSGRQIFPNGFYQI